MLFTSIAAASLLALCSTATAASLPHKRATESGVTLYGYGNDALGDGSNGGEVFYADGLAYITNGTMPTWASVATKITFTLDSESTTTAWTISPNSTTVTFNETDSMYIVPTTGSITQVGFASSSDTLPTDAVTTGFAFFGTTVAYAASDSDYQISFWASTTNTTGVWGLYWNAQAATSDLPNGSFPVTIKTTPPTVLDVAK